MHGENKNNKLQRNYEQQGIDIYNTQTIITSTPNSNEYTAKSELMLPQTLADEFHLQFDLNLNAYEFNTIQLLNFQI